MQFGYLCIVIGSVRMKWLYGDYLVFTWLYLRASQQPAILSSWIHDGISYSSFFFMYRNIVMIPPFLHAMCVICICYVYLYDLSKQYYSLF